MTQQRLLPIKHGYNFRDLGGYQTSDGHTVKWHRLIRSGALNNLDEQDQEASRQSQLPLTLICGRSQKSPPPLTGCPEPPSTTTSLSSVSTLPMPLAVTRKSPEKCRK